MKASENVTHWGQAPSKVGSHTWQCCPHGCGFRVMKDKQVKDYGIFLCSKAGSLRPSMGQGMHYIEAVKDYCVKL